MERGKGKIINSMFKKLFKTQKNVPGFSLIEMLAVIFIVAVGLVGTSQLVVQSLKAQTINRRTIIAYQLAQEGIELVRYIRDTNWLMGRTWNEGIVPGVHCIDYENPVLEPSSPDLDACYLYLDENNWYHHPTISFNEETQTEFMRQILIMDDAYGFSSPYGIDAMKVRVTVEWYEGGTQLRYEAETELYNWY